MYQLSTIIQLLIHPVFGPLVLSCVIIFIIILLVLYFIRKAQNPYYFAVGLAIAAFYIYVRVIVQRIPHLINYNYNPTITGLFLLMLLTQSYLLIKHIYPTPASYLVTALQKLYLNALITLGEEILARPGCVRSLLKICSLQKKLIDIFHWRLIIGILITIHILIPLFIAITYAVDICFLHEYKLFFKAIPLLTVTLLWDSIYGLLAMQNQKFLTQIQNNFTIKNYISHGKVTSILRIKKTSHLTSVQQKNLKNIYNENVLFLNFYVIGLFGPDSTLYKKKPLFWLKALTFLFYILGALFFLLITTYSLLGIQYLTMP